MAVQDFITLHTVSRLFVATAGLAFLSAAIAAGLIQLVWQRIDKHHRRLILLQVFNGICFLPFVHSIEWLFRHSFH
jgi:fucose permease